MLADWYGFLERAPAEFRDGHVAEVAFLVATLFAYDRKAYRVARAGNGDTRPQGEAPPDATQTSESAAERSAPASPGRNFGGTLGGLVEAQRSEDDAMARRLAILLDSSLAADGGGTLPWRLRRIVRLALSKDAQIDWPRLLEDLLAWNHPSRRVQRAWAQAFYRIGVSAQAGAEDEIGALVDES